MDKDPETESAFWVPHSETTNWLTVFQLYEFYKIKKLLICQN